MNNSVVEMGDTLNFKIFIRNSRYKDYKDYIIVSEIILNIKSIKIIIKIDKLYLFKKIKKIIN